MLWSNTIWTSKIEQFDGQMHTNLRAEFVEIKIFKHDLLKLNPNSRLLPNGIKYLYNSIMDVLNDLSVSHLTLNYY